MEVQTFLNAQINEKIMNKSQRKHIIQRYTIKQHFTSKN